MDSIPEQRIRQTNSGGINAEGDFVLYWMVAFRRTRWNFALERTAEWARKLRKPLLVFEPLCCDYRWASDRLHQFVLQGMVDNATRLEQKRAFYFPFVEPKTGAGKGLLAALSKQACVVVGDDYPCFVTPRVVQAASRKIPVCFELVDSNGLLPLRAADKVFARAHDFRRFLQKNLRPHLFDFPRADPLAGLRLPQLDGLPASVQRKWPAAKPVELLANARKLASFPIDHTVTISPTRGGAQSAQSTLRRFLKSNLAHYQTQRNQPEQDVTSGLSPFLHFGHISVHQVFTELMDGEGWSPGQIAEKASGSASGWWGTSPEVEAFLDELITWREVGYNMCWQRDDHDQYESLPEWAMKTLADHALDRRQYIYSPAEFQAAATHDPLWNAAQTQLVREGRIHNYLRMVWGKKILEWSPSPRDALETMIELNNKYALDGRDPNSYSGIFWCMGRYDRAWGPERPIFGKVRYMSSENTARKVRVKGYIEKYSS